MSDGAANGELLQQAAAELLGVLQQLGRDDLASRITAASARLRRPSTVVCVVGEFKQGKSSLVNGLLGQAVCPVDDDMATAAITLVRHADAPSAVVRRREGEEHTAVTVAIDELGSWVSEAGNPGNEKHVERVDIGVESPILRQGLALVDTPGMGGMGAGHAAATLAFLPFADGLVFVSDTSAELSAPEMEFLAQATDLCPTVLVAQTKIDLYPAWRRIVERNQGHLAARGIAVPLVAVSNHLRSEALARRDRELNGTSGFPALLQALGVQVVEPAKAHAAERSARDVQGVATEVAGAVEQELALLRDPSQLQAALAGLEAAKARLEYLRGPGARWSQVVGDRVADLSNEVTHQFRGAVRGIHRSMDTEIEKLSTPQEWDDLARDLQTKVAEAVTAAFVTVEAGRREARDAVVELLQEEDLGGLSSGTTINGMDVSDLWTTEAVAETGSKTGRAFKTGLSGVRGAQSGVMMLGMVGQFLPAAAAVFVASNPVLLGAGALFGSMHVMEERKRKVTTRRQAARSQVRQFLDDVQFEVGNELGNLFRSIQRELRDEFTERLGELQRTYTDTARQAQENVQRGQVDAQQRQALLEAMLATLARVRVAATTAVGAA